MNDTAPPGGAGSMVDWGLAVATARRLVRPGPNVSTAEARRVVDELRRDAAAAEEHVFGYTGLTAGSAEAPVVVVDRPGWVQANADAFAGVLAPLTERLAERQSTPSGPMGAIGRRLTGLEAGALLAFLSGRVLGQFDPFWSSSTNGASGRLLLVAPNIVHVERELEVEPSDFRLWVCLHEETHRVQFTAVPWLRDYFHGQIAELLAKTDLDPSALAAQLRRSAGEMGRVLRGTEDTTILDIIQTPEQKVVLDRLTALMSLLEGHADVVMDGVGPDVVPSVETIRSRFAQRRSGGSFGDQMLKRLLGLDAKLKQYREGAAFVRFVVDAVGMAGFNRIWEGPESLPTREEITEPEAWVRRMRGTAALEGSDTDPSRD